jgi:cephalosporin hydroxylase
MRQPPVRSPTPNPKHTTFLQEGNSLLNEEIEIAVTQGENRVILKQKDIVDLFHQLYYDSRVWENTYYYGYPVLKCPLDLWIYEEMIVELRPDFIIETGTFLGASALYMALACDMVNNGKVITIDIQERPDRPPHPRITYLTGSSVDEGILKTVRETVGEGKKVMVILDSDHSKEHVYNEMKAFHFIVSVGSYLIVEDTDVNGHPVRPDFGPGPMEAIAAFLSENQNFVVDTRREKFLMTQNPNGFLKRVK